MFIIVRILCVAMTTSGVGVGHMTLHMHMYTDAPERKGSSPEVRQVDPTTVHDLNPSPHTNVP